MELNCILQSLETRYTVSSCCNNHYRDYTSYCDLLLMVFTRESSYCFSAS